MNFKSLPPHESISLFVKNILTFEESEQKQKTVLPFFADGYPGLMFQETENGLLVKPHNKLMPRLFLYGQTIRPIQLEMTGAYKLIVFQLYPFVLKSFFKVTPKQLNDDCYDLSQLKNAVSVSAIERLNNINSVTKRTDLITSFLYSILQEKITELDFTISKALQIIISKKGLLIIGDLYDELHLTERTFERRFLNTVGVTAKQFAKIIQFQQSFEQVTIKDYTRLAEIAYANGFADQSHFIKVFKAFTGKTPLAFKSKR
jgi:AraC-like DNA-binding protein